MIRSDRRQQEAEFLEQHSAQKQANKQAVLDTHNMNQCALGQNYSYQQSLGAHS